MSTRRRVLLPAAILLVTSTVWAWASAIADARPDRTVAQQLMHERAAWHAERGRLVRIIRQRPDVQTALRLASLVYRVPLGQLDRVAFCESSHRPWARNGRYRGLFQMGPMFERTPFGRAGLSVWDPYVAALATASVVSVQGWRQWECWPGG